MKISKKSVLIMGGILCTASFGLLYVSADRELFMNPSNAVQHMENVKFISTDTANDTTATFKKSNDFIKIETNNLILGQTGDKKNSIITSYNSIILGGEKNAIVGSADVIIGGSGNLVRGTYNSILGGEGNKIEGYQSFNTIIGGKNNQISGNFTETEIVNYNVTVGGSNNIISSGSNSVVMGNNSSVAGFNSVALGSGSKIQANNSFLWTDGNNSDTLTKNNIFAVMASKGAIIDTDTAHSFAKLTLGKSLILSGNEIQSNIKCGSGKGGGIIKIEKSETTNQMCLCSCDGNSWNSMSKGSCIDVCHGDNSTPINPPKCGNKVQRICTAEGIILYSGSCENGNVIEGTGAYFVDKNNVVHRSCQTDNGAFTGCSANGSNIVGNISDCITGTPTYSCTGPKPENATLVAGSDQNLTANTKNKLYESTTAANGEKCAYVCDDENGYVFNNNVCIKTYNKCQGTRPNHSDLWHPSAVPNNNTTRYTYSATGTREPCKFKCSYGFSYEETTEDCLENKCQGTKPDHSVLRHSNVVPDNHTTRYEYSATDTQDPCKFKCIYSNHSYDETTNKCIENAACNLTYDGQSFSNLESNNDLCKVGAVNLFQYHTSTNQWTWQCVNGSSRVDCSANKIKNKHGITHLIEGNRINKYMRNLSNIYPCKEIMKGASYHNTCIRHFKEWPGNNIPEGVKTETISTPKSEIPVKIRYDKEEHTIYFYTEAETIYMNKDSSSMFKDLLNLEDIEPLGNWNTSQVTNMVNMFAWGESLKDISVLSNWDTSQVTSMGAMFDGCKSLTSIEPLSNWDTSQVTSMLAMFQSCESIRSAPLNNWDTSQVTDMHRMFLSCKNLISVDISNWDTSQVTNMRGMFENCSNLTTIDLSNWDTNKVENNIIKNMDRMFLGCSNLRKIYVSDKFKKVFLRGEDMFDGDRLLEGWNGTKYINTYYGKSALYARIDGRDGRKGYFTYKAPSN